MCRIKQLVSVAAVSGLLVFTAHARAGTVTGFSGVSLSVYANPFDPNEDFNASETTASFGDPATGMAGGWLINSDDGQLTHGVDRRDGRVFFGNTSSFIYNPTDSTGPAAFIQLTAPNTFRVGTVITSHDTDFSSYTTPQPFTLQFNNGASIGKTNADWAAVTPLTSGPGTVGDNSIVVTQGFAPFTADTVRVAFSSTTSAGSNSQATIQEIVALPDSLMQLHTGVTPAAGAGHGYSEDDSGLSGAGLIDGQGGANSGSTPAGIWDDFSGAAVTSKFFTINVLDPLPINAMVLYGDEASPGEQFDIFDDADVMIGHVAFDAAFPGEVLPIRFDTPVLTTSLRFQMTSSPVSGFASMREVVLLTDTPEPASLALLGVGALVLIRRRRVSRLGL